MRNVWAMLFVVVAGPIPALTLDPSTIDLPPGQHRAVTLTNDTDKTLRITATQNPLSVALDAVILPPPKPVTKWFPGHYQTIKSAAYSGPRAWEREPFRSALAHPKMRGLLLYINWRELEPARGVFDFTQIDQALAGVGAINKKLWIKVQDRSFHNEPGGNAPDYVSREGCMFGMADQNTPNPTDVKGLALKWYIPRCVDLFLPLYRTMGARYDSDPRFFAVTVGDGESALSGAPQQPDYTTPTIHIDQIIRATTETKKAWATTLVATGLNMLPDAKQFYRIGDALAAAGGCAFTHPDTIPGKKMGGTLEEIRMRGVIPTLAQGQQTAIDPLMPNAEQKIFDWATQTIGVSAFAWGDGWRGKGNYVSVRVIPFLNSPASNWPAENLACPKSAQPCSP
jgi:hypothetical protein